MSIDQMTDDELIKLASTDFESVLKSRGYKFGWYKPTEYVGYIYIMVNPNWKEPGTNKELSKIGYTDSLEQRVRAFSGTGYPYPSHCYAAYKVTDRLVDKPLHVLIDMLAPNLRIFPNKEYFELPKEQAYSILESIAKVTGTIDCLELNPLKDEYFESDDIDGEDDSTNGIKNKFSFGLVGIPIGSTLTWFKDSSITCVVKDSENTVTYNGVDYKANDLTRKLTGKKNQYSAYRRWDYNGVRIEKMFNEKKGLNDGQYVRKRPPMNFLELELKPGDELECIKDQSIKVKIVDGRRVEYNGEVTSLTQVAEKCGYKNESATTYFSYNGEPLGKIANRTQWKGLEKGHLPKK